MKIILTFIFFLFYTLSFSQDLQAFDKVYTKTFLETSNKDLKLAQKIADSLYQSSTNPLLKSRSLMLSATLYKQAGDIKKSVEYGLKSLNLIQGTEHYAYITKNYGFLATQYRMLKFYEQSKQYLEKAIITSAKIKDPDLANIQMGLILQEKAYYELEFQQYEKAIELLKRSQKYFDIAKSDQPYLTISNEHLLGSSYYETGDLKTGKLHYEKALDLSKNEPQTFLTGLIYNGLALIYIKEKDAVNAKKHIDLSQEVYKNSQFLELKNEIYTTSQKYYELTKDLENLVAIQKKKDTLGQEISSKYREYIIDSYTDLQQSVQKANEDLSQKNKFLIVSIIFILCGTVIFYLFKKRQKAKLQTFRKIIDDLDAKIKTRTHLKNEISIDPINEEEPKTERKEANEDSAVLISNKSVEKIISKLEKFENALLFTKKNMSLPNLATYCETNIKYLSFVIKTQKDKDFSTYINDLRIDYIIMKLKNDKDYRRYKIAALADEAGFSSPNKFATVFKSSTSFPPSIFIKYLEEENEE